MTCPSPEINPSFGFFLFQENQQNNFVLQCCVRYWRLLILFFYFDFFSLTKAERTFETGYGVYVSQIVCQHSGRLGPNLASLRTYIKTLDFYFAKIYKTIVQH
jgi:hypothetical protein